MDFFSPQSFSDLLVFFVAMIAIVAPLLSVIGVLMSRWLWAVVPASKMQAIADKMERMQQTVMQPTGQRLIGTADKFSKLHGWPFNGRKRP
ncbi:hypothetical protein [Bordetella genomosp. 4]|uniref:hypothetical protein n=1 Tax=Bordetella genomosp. 4 TaxID=463044 RepID=UPI000B9E9298|nr:hypothetical protein [Bordetella genomosp. 4]OZI49403.1 hypothetical protein CAL21_07385 [Bordetella genomosp. 4]